MSIRTDRRAAELSVIEAARNVATMLPPMSPILATLEGPLNSLDRLSLAEPNRARANKGAPVTAKQAAAWMNGERALSLAGKIFRHIHMRGTAGFTTEEMENWLRGKHQTISARFNELAATGWIEDSGRTRMNTTGRKAIVYIATVAGQQAVARGREL